MEQNKIYFFGYGANRDAAKISKILGKTPVYHIGAELEDYVLCYQTLDQIPEPPRKLLETAWGPAFKAYTIHPGKGVVAGVVWEFEPEDFVVMKKWEFDGFWRQFIPVKVKTSDGKVIDAVTEKAIKSNLNNGTYDGLNYPNNLNVNNYLITDTEEVNEDIYKIEQLRKLRSELYSSSQVASV